MGNIITDTVGKIAGNVTQSVVSALIVTAITTYLVVFPGKKDEAKDASGKDSANSTTNVVPKEGSGAAGEGGRSVHQPMETANPESGETGKSMNAAGETKTVAVPATVTKAAPGKTESPVTNAASKAYKELPPEEPTEKKLESTITQGRAKGDSLLKAHPQDDKAKEVNKEEKKETKDVKKRADDVFDELDQEVKK